MQKLRKKIIISSLTVLMIGLAVFVGRFDKNVYQKPAVELSLCNDVKISPWKDENSDILYYFLPAYADASDVILVVNEGKEIKIDGKSLLDGNNISGLEYNKVYSMSTQDGKSYKVQFMKSENISSVFVTTATGSMNAVYQDKSHKELAKITVIDGKGNVSITTNEARIKGRGNSTWQNRKKPFSIVFNKPESMLGMEASTEWALLANALDYSAIRNAIVYNTAKNIGLEDTPEYRFADLYLNGEYNGLYMISQTVDTFFEQSYEDDGLYLFTAELPERVKKANYLLSAEDGEAYIEVCAPKKLHSEDKKAVQNIVNNLDNNIKNGDESITNVIDLNSWVKKYLLDEVFENYDSGLASSYFYTKSNSDDSIVYAGPIWDYDISIGNPHCFDGTTRNPEILFANQEYRTENQHLLWYSKLYSNPVFYEAMVDTFENDLLPQLESLINNDIKVLEQEVKKSKTIDDIRWGKDSSEEYDYMIEYLSKRQEFLKSVWLENKDFVEVTYYTPGKDSNYMRVYVPRGTAISTDSDKLNLFNQSDKWYIDGTEEVYDFDSPVEEDIVLVNAYTNGSRIVNAIKSVLNNASSEVKLVVILFSVLSLVVMLRLLQISMNMKRGIRWEI